MLRIEVYVGGEVNTVVKDGVAEHTAVDNYCNLDAEIDNFGLVDVADLAETVVAGNTAPIADTGLAVGTVPAADTARSVDTVLAVGFDWAVDAVETAADTEGADTVEVAVGTVELEKLGWASEQPLLAEVPCLSFL